MESRFVIAVRRDAVSFPNTNLVKEQLLDTNENVAERVGPANINIAYKRIGDADAPPVLLIQGLGAQLIGWPSPGSTPLKQD